MTNVLFVCTMNRLRSPTAEAVFAAYPGVETMSAGTDLGAENPVSDELIRWADIIFVMEDHHWETLRRRFGPALHNKRVIVLDIPDIYEYMDPELVELLRAKVPRHLPGPGRESTVSWAIMRDECVVIRPFTQDDVDAVLDVYRQCEDFLALGPVPVASMPMVLADIETLRREGGVFCVVLSAGSEAIGVVDFVAAGFERDLCAAFISLLMISRLYRRRGIGARVLRLVEREITKDTNVTSIFSVVQTNNPEALRFWQENGYNVTSGPERQTDGTMTFRLRKDCSGSA